MAMLNSQMVYYVTFMSNYWRVRVLQKICDSIVRFNEDNNTSIDWSSPHCSADPANHGVDAVAQDRSGTGPAFFGPNSMGS